MARIDPPRAWSGPEQEQLGRALLSAFDHNGLSRMVRYRLSRSLEAVAMGPDLTSIVFRLVERAVAEGWIPALIDAARGVNPGNPLLLEFVASIGGRSGFPSASEMEAYLRFDNAFVDAAPFRATLARMEPRICQIETPGNLGTGFLVGPDLVMTCQHVIDPIVQRRYRPDQVHMRFDYARLEDRTSINEGTRFQLAADWLVDSSLPSPYERRLSTVEVPPTAEEMDYAILRVDGAPGDGPIGRREAEPGALRRGWVGIPRESQPLENHAPLHILQHPNGLPLQLALETDAIEGRNESGNRLWYRTNSRGGSSGAPCFDREWRLVALHRGTADVRGTARNEGIPISAIRSLLVSRGIAERLIEPPSDE